MIREATADDIPDLLVLFEQMHAGGPFDRFKAGETALALIDSDLGLVLRSERGVLMGYMDHAWYSQQLWIAVEKCCWADDGKWLALFKGFADWAQAQGADEVHISSKLSDKSWRIAKVFSRMGFDPMQICYRKAL